MPRINKKSKPSRQALDFIYNLSMDLLKTWTCLVHILLLSLFLIATPKVGYAKTLIVGVDYSTITSALKKTEEGDLIEVRGGNYNEKLEIQKSIHLKGVGNPVISVSKGNIIEISSPGVIVEGFTLKYSGSDLSPMDSAVLIKKGADNAVVRNNRLLGVRFGVWNLEGNNIRIENNTIEGQKNIATNFRGNCINLTGSQRVHVVGNTLSYCRDGIYMEICHDATITENTIKESRYSIHTMWVDRGVFSKNTVHDNLVGLAIMYTDHAKINDNLAYGNKTHGLLFIQSLRSQISGNTVIANTKGIFLHNSVYNKITSNLIMNNQLGIHSWGGSVDNIISENSFINNEIQVKHVASKDQEWNNNYWSDYLGWDMNSDGKGDAPYESNSIVDHIFWRYPIAKLLFASPSLQVLWMLEKQFPLLDVPKIVDNKPSMLPLHAKWKEMLTKYSSYAPERYYGELEKISPGFN